MVTLQEKAYLVYEETKHDWWGGKICAGQATLYWTRAGQLQQYRDPNYTRCIQTVTLRVFLQKSIQDQKPWMRCFLKKPKDMLVQDYIA